MKELRTIEEAEAAPAGTIVDDGWGEEWERRGDDWVREVWCTSEELIENGPVTVREDESEAA